MLLLLPIAVFDERVRSRSGLNLEQRLSLVLVGLEQTFLLEMTQFVRGSINVWFNYCFTCLVQLLCLSFTNNRFNCLIKSKPQPVKLVSYSVILPLTK